MRVAKVWMMLLGAAACSPPEDQPRVRYREQVYSLPELRRLGLRVPHLAVTRELAQQRLVAAFDSEAESVTYTHQSQGDAPRQGTAEPLCSLPTWFMDVSDYQFPSFLLAPGEGLMGMFQVAGENWNARIGRIDTSSCPGVVTIYDEPGFAGNTQTFGPGLFFIDLSHYPLELSSWSNNTRSIRSTSYFSFEGHDTSSARRNVRSAVLTLQAGQVLHFGTCGLPGASGEGDTYLRLYDAQGNEVAANDDSCGGLSFVSYAVPAGAGGPHELRVGCFDDTRCGGTVAYSFFSTSR
jgi:hypothetical protein